jgi:hypothetical protein
MTYSVPTWKYAVFPLLSLVIDLIEGLCRLANMLLESSVIPGHAVEIVKTSLLCEPNDGHFRRCFRRHVGIYSRDTTNLASLLELGR